MSGHEVVMRSKKKTILGSVILTRVILIRVF